MSKTIVIIGVTGVQGSSVAKTFLSLSGWKIRGITRNPSSPAARDLASKGVELVKADLDDKDSLVPAFKGATVIFANTDFFAHLFAAIESPKIAGDRGARKYAYDRELAQCTNIIEAASSRLVLETLKRFVFSALSDATRWSIWKHTKVYHYDVKAEVISRIKWRFPSLCFRMSSLQMGYYVTNWKQMPALAPQKQADGSFVVRAPFDPDTKMPFAVAHEDTGAFIKALVDMEPEIDLAGISEVMTWPAWTKLWGETLGVKATYEKVPTEKFFAGVHEELAGELEDGCAYLEDFGHTGRDPRVLEPVEAETEHKIKIPRTSMAQYIKSEDWSSIL